MNIIFQFKKAFLYYLNSGITGGMDVEAVRKIRLLNISSAICAIFLIPLSIKSYFLTNYFLFAVDILIIILFVFSFFYIKKTSRYDIATHIVIHALFGLLIYLVYNGGIGNTGPVWIFLFPMAAYFLYGLKRGFIYTLLFTMGVSLFLLFAVPFPGSTVYLPVFRLRIFYSYLAVALFATLYENVREINFQRMKQLSEKLGDMAKHDHLTGLLNRRGMNELLEYEHERSKRNRSAFSVLMGDIDFFKKINDDHGHDAGDYILTRLSELLNSQKRAQDLIARWGGEEFLMLLPGTDLQGAMIHAEKIRKTIEEFRFSYEDRELSIKMSFGAAGIGPETSPEKGITEADKYLLLAKSSGRNKVLSVLNMD